MYTFLENNYKNDYKKLDFKELEWIKDICKKITGKKYTIKDI